MTITAQGAPKIPDTPVLPAGWRPVQNVYGHNHLRATTGGYVQLSATEATNWDTLTFVAAPR